MASAMEQIRLAVGELEQGNDEACISTLQTLLLQPRLSLFWRIHALALLAHSEDGWLEAKNYQIQAEMLWRLSRRLLARGVDDEFDRTLQINRGFLDQIAVMMVNEMPDELKGSQEEAETEIQQGSDGDNDSSDGDEGPGEGFDNGLSNESEDSCGERGDEDEFDHEGDEQEVEILEIRHG